MTHSYISGSAFGQQLRRLGLTALLAGGTALAAQAQFGYVPSLTYSVAGTYTDLGTNGTVIATANTDDANSAAQTIPFTFNYNGSTFTQFVLNTNGLIRLGAAGPASVAAASPYATSPASGPVNSADAADVNLIMPFNFDLTAGTSTPEYRMYTTGTAPNRVCTIQWKNVSDKAIASSATSATLVPTQYTNFSFQAKLYEGTAGQIEFVYSVPTVGTTDALKLANVGLKGSDNTAGNNILAIKASTSAWSGTAFTTGPQSTTGNSHNFRATVPPDAGRTYRFTAPVANDAAVTAIFTLGKLPAAAAVGHIIQATIFNAGTTALTNQTLTLSVTGANTFTDTKTVPAIATGDGYIISFNALPTNLAQGVNNITVSIASDGNNGNNSVTTQQTVNNTGTFSYVPTNMSTTISSSLGGVYNTGSTTASAGAIFGVTYTSTVATTVTAVNAFIADANSVGKTVAGVVVSSAGAVIATSAPYIIQASDISTYKSFAIISPPSVAAGGDFIVGLQQAAYTTTGTGTSVRYFPVGYQQEDVNRATNTFLYFPTATGGTSQDFSGYRFLIEAVVSARLLATSKELQRAISVYPNPSTSGVFNLDVHNANATGNLSVEVTNQLGQRVYTGSAHDNFTTVLDLSSLAAGIYNLKVRNGEDFTSGKISIVK
ncbi:MAG: T9SS type A sorting domain-containing protein [Janthinobacterium lividum]